MREVKKTSASSAQPELAEVDAPACRKKTAKLAAVWINSVAWSSWPTLVGVAYLPQELSS